MAPDTSIIILTKNGGNRFKDLLSRLRSQTYDPSVETIVIDSGSTDGTVNAAESFGANIYEIPPDQFHHSRTRNFGARKAKGDKLVYLTQDALPTSNTWLNNLVKPLNQDIAAVYGRQIARQDAKPMDKFFYTYFYPKDEQILSQDDIIDPRQFYLNNIFVSDVCSAMHHDVWKEIRFDETINMSEDKDFALRLLQQGYKIAYEPTATVCHSHDYSLRSKLVRRFRDGAAFSRIAPEGDDQFVSEGFDYVIEELRFLATSGYLHWIPYAVLYDFAHFIGFQLGKYKEQLPGADQLMPS